MAIVDQYTPVSFATICYGAALLNRAGYVLGFATHFLAMTALAILTLSRIFPREVLIEYSPLGALGLSSRISLQDEHGPLSAV